MTWLIRFSSRRLARGVATAWCGSSPKAYMQVTTQRAFLSRIEAPKEVDGAREDNGQPALPRIRDHESNDTKSAAVADVILATGAKPGSGDGDGREKTSSSWNWGKWWARFGVGPSASAIVAVASVAAVMYQQRANEEQRLQTVDGQAELAAERISSSRLKPVQLLSAADALIERKDLVDKILASLSRSMGIVLLYGPRGGGKSTALKLAFRDTQSVVEVRVSHRDQGFLGDFLVSALGGKVPDGATGDAIIEQALESLKEKRSCTIPIVIVSVDSKCSGQQLEDILVLCKRWGADMQLAKFFVDVSSSRAALQVKIGLTKLRVSGLKVGELSQKEAELYLIKVLGGCSALEGDWRADGTVCTLGQYAIERVGKVVLELLQLARSCQDSSDDPQRLKQQIDKHVTSLDDENYASLLQFFNRLEALELRDRFQGLLKKLARAEVVSAEELVVVEGKEPGCLVEVNAATEPHVLEVDPFNKHSSLSSISMHRAVNRYLEEQRRLEQQRQLEEQRQRRDKRFVLWGRGGSST